MLSLRSEPSGTGWRDVLWGSLPWRPNLALAGTPAGCLSAASDLTATGGFGVGTVLAVVGGFVGGAVLSAANGFAAGAVPGRDPSLRTIAVVATVAPPVTATTVPTIAIRRIAIPASSLAAGQGRRDLRLALSGPEKLEPFRFVPGRSGRKDSSDQESVDVLFGVYPEVIPGGGSIRKENCLQHPSGFSGPNGPPGPTAVLPTAGQFDLHAGHGQQR